MREDAEHLRAAGLFFLPPDQYGRTTLYLNRTKVKKGCDLKAIVSVVCC